jgi:hypothetical protein
MRAFFILTILFSSMLAPLSAQAQVREPASYYDDTVQKYAYRADPLFDGLVRDVLSMRDLRMSFTNFRKQYTRTSQYAPIADTIVDKMLKAAFDAQNATNEAQAQRHYDTFNALVMDHMANLKVVLQALALARTDARFGDVKVLEWVREGLMKNLMVSGEGKSLDDAYDVITLEEEIILLSKLGIKPEQTLSNREGVVYYNMHDYTDKKTGRPATLFVNTSFPMRYLEAKSKVNKSGRVNALRQ